MVEVGSARARVSYTVVVERRDSGTLPGTICKKILSKEFSPF